MSESGLNTMTTKLRDVSEPRQLLGHVAKTISEGLTVVSAAESYVCLRERC